MLSKTNFDVKPAPKSDIQGYIYTIISRLSCWMKWEVRSLVSDFIPLSLYNKYPHNCSISLHQYRNLLTAHWTLLILSYPGSPHPTPPPSVAQKSSFITTTTCGSCLSPAATITTNIVPRDPRELRWNLAFISSPPATWQLNSAQVFHRQTGLKLGLLTSIYVCADACSSGGSFFLCNCWCHAWLVSYENVSCVSL